jgi:hypothetical protein
MDRKSWAWSMGTAGYNQKDDYMNRAMREVRQALEEREQQRAQAEEAEETEKADEPF